MKTTLFIFLKTYSFIHFKFRLSHGQLKTCTFHFIRKTYPPLFKKTLRYFPVTMARQPKKCYFATRLPEIGTTFTGSWKCHNFFLETCVTKSPGIQLGPMFCSGQFSGRGGGIWPPMVNRVKD